MRTIAGSAREPRTGRTFLGLGWAALVLLTLGLTGAGLAWGCVPQPLISVHPSASGPPGGQVRVDALAINGRAEIRWNSPEGPLLETPTGPFSVTVTIPDVPPGLYSLIVIERAPGGAMGSTGTAAFAVTAPGGQPTFGSGFGGGERPPPSLSPAGPSSPQPATSQPVLVLGAVGVLLGGGIGGALLARRFWPS